MPWFTPTQTLSDPLPVQQLTLRQGDRLSAFAAIIEDEYGTPLDLTNARCFMTLRPLTVNAYGLMLDAQEITIEDAETGLVSYDWQVEDTLGASPGIYDIHIEVVYASGDTITVPTGDQAATINLRSSVLSDYFYMHPSGKIMTDLDGNFLEIDEDPDAVVPDEVLVLTDGTPRLTPRGYYTTTTNPDALLDEDGGSLLTEDDQILILE